MHDVDFTRCRMATTRAYRELCSKGVHEPRAFTAAMRVFGYHCPSLNNDAARDIVAAWVDNDLNALN